MQSPDFGNFYSSFFSPLILDSQLQVHKFLNLFSQATEEGIQDTVRDRSWYLNLTPFSHTGELYVSLWTENTEKGPFSRASLGFFLLNLAVKS